MSMGMQTCHDHRCSIYSSSTWQQRCVLVPELLQDLTERFAAWASLLIVLDVNESCSLPGKIDFSRLCVCDICPASGCLTAA